MNPKAARLTGVNLARIRMLVWALAGLISSVAALLITPKILITPDIGHIAILAYAAAIVGGITSLPGAVVGGFVIGVAENLWACSFPPTPSWSRPSSPSWSCCCCVLKACWAANCR